MTTDKKDNLQTLLDTQYALQEYLGTWSKITDESTRQQFVNQMILAMFEETVEIMRETAYKKKFETAEDGTSVGMPFGWKKNQNWNTDNFKEEIIDLFHFVGNLCLVAGMNSDEILERYLAKNAENIARQQRGY